RRGGADEVVQGHRRDRAGRAERLARRAGRIARRHARAQQGRLARGRWDPLHARERVPFLERRRRRLYRRGVRDRHPARARQDALLRGRHMRIRRHGADRTDLQAECRHPSDRRLLHDGAPGGRGRAGAARQPALRAVPLGHVPGADGNARRARTRSAELDDRAARTWRHDPALIVATYSIAACDLERGQWGVATQSKFLAVGSVVPWAEPGAGALATQAYANPRYGPEGLALLRRGLGAQDVGERLTAPDEG